MLSRNVPHSAMTENAHAIKCDALFEAELEQGSVNITTLYSWHCKGSAPCQGVSTSVNSVRLCCRGMRNVSWHVQCRASCSRHRETVWHLETPTYPERPLDSLRTKLQWEMDLFELSWCWGFLRISSCTRVQLKDFQIINQQSQIWSLFFKQQ